MNPNVELVTTGSELLSGRTLNRHAQTLGEHLQSLGLKLVRDTTVPDDIPIIRDTVGAALQRVDMVVVSGGLGPTSDDITREALAELLGRKIVMDIPSRDELRKKLQRMGRQVSEAADRQAKIVEGAAALSNAVGAAPGQRIELGEKVMFVLPGPPREFLAVLDDHVMPWLRQRFGALKRAAEKTFSVCGLGESDIVRRFEEAGFPPAGVAAAYSAAPGRVDIKIAAADAALVEKTAGDVRRILKPNIFTEERLPMEEVVGRLLAAGRATLATAESCTGGLVGHRVTAVSGSSTYYLGGIVAYANDVKTRELGVSPATLQAEGAVSEAVAREMAAGVRKKLGADYGLGVTGIAGPTGGTPEKPVGLVYVALADRDNTWVKRFQFGGDRGWIKEWSSQMALDLLRRRLEGVL